MRTKLLGGLSVVSLLLPAVTSAQAPRYVVTPAVKPGDALGLALIGQPGMPFASFADLSGGPQTLLGEELFIGLSAGLTPIDGGTLDLGGLHVRSIPIPATGVPIGVVFYLQSLVLDSSAPNGIFRASNGESSVIYNSSNVMVEEFVDPAAQGYTGEFDRTRQNRLMGAPVTHRVHTVQPQHGSPFQQPILGPLHPNGARVQMVYRATDLGATGKREVLTALRWLPFGTVSAETHSHLVVDAVHTDVVPDFSIDPLSKFPRFPASGLSTTFASNPKAGDRRVRIVDGAYAIRPQDVRADGYVSYPTPMQDFVYNGFNSMLLEFQMDPTPGLVGRNGQQIQLMVLSSAQPNARAYAQGTPAAPLDPRTVATGRGDNSVTYMQFEFASVESVATSPWRASPIPSPDYGVPTIAASIPAGTSVVVEFRGADTATGAGAAYWSTNVSTADRKPFLQYRVTLTGNARTGAVPSVESIVVPIN